jgi:CHASE3 domain sensor protein
MPNTYGLNRSLGGAIAAIALVAILSGIVVVTALGNLNTATETRRQAYGTIRSLGEFRAAMLNQETGLRGFLLTGRQTSLEPYRSGSTDLEGSMVKLRAATASSPAEAELLDAAIASARAWQRRSPSPRSSTWPMPPAGRRP